jgi:uncharacterized protein (DUF305 family)
MKRFLLALGLVALAPAAFAAPAAKPAKPLSAAECIDRAPSVMEYKAGMKIMHRDMDIIYSGDADIDFAAGMFPHHQGAVDMAETELRFGKDPEMRKLAAWIIYTQKQEIQFMKHWLYVRGYEVPAPAAAMKGHEHHVMARYASPELANDPAVKEYVEAMNVMHKGMNIQYTGNADIDFARGMIPHHQGAVDMALTLKRYGKNLEMSKLADGIISTQRQEIGLMKDWLAKKGIK